MDLNPHHPFQKFTVEAFNQPENQKILLALQKDYGINPNIFLFNCWVAQTGRGRLTKKQTYQVITAVYPWHEQVVLSLHNICQMVLKQSKLIKQLHEQIRAEEYTADIMEQLMIIESLPELIAKPRSLKQQINHCLKNLTTYAQELHIHFDNYDCNKICKLLAT